MNNQYRGWIPSRPDSRDFRMSSPNVSGMFKALGIMGASSDVLPSCVDLRPGCSPIEDQGNLGSCTAHACIGLYEYLERKAFGDYKDASRLFTYKVTRNIMGLKGDSGADLRSTAGSTVYFGVLPEKFMRYNIRAFETEPNAFQYNMAGNYKAKSYVRLDTQDHSASDVLTSVKSTLAAGWPMMFGFDVYASIDAKQVTVDGLIPYPVGRDPLIGGHAVLAVGYDDTVKCPGADAGSLIIRNSWGPKWGCNGYGYLPYQFVQDGKALDFWTIMKMDWVESGQFGL